MNDAKQVAFSYELANGTYGVAVIQIVPEVGVLTLWLGAIGAIGLLNRRLRRP